jgi:hypothetical protein
MVRLAGNKWLCLIFTAYLALAVTGTFAFSIAETFDAGFGELENNWRGSGGFLSSMDHALDWLITDSTVIGRARGFSTSPMRNGALRIFMPPGLHNDGAYSACLSVPVINKQQVPAIKNTILLKLRI